MFAWTDNEPSAAQVEKCLRDGAVMSWMNLGEVEYINRRRFGADHADNLIATLERLVETDAVSPDRVRAAARLKAAHAMSYADCFAVATALALGLPLLTGDPEIVNAGVPGLRVVDLR